MKSMILFFSLIVAPLTLNATTFSVLHTQEEFQPYYDAIAAMRTLPAFVDLEGHISNGFEAHTTPTFGRCRTPFGMYLEIKSGYMDCLWTPFGQVHLLWGGPRDTLSDVTKAFFDSGRWDLEDVTDTVHRHAVDLSDDRKTATSLQEVVGFYKESYKEAKDNTRLYFIKRADTRSFRRPQPHHVFQLIKFNWDALYPVESSLFHTLSGGKDCF